jgi:glycerol-3-phosphate dehydrogenase (NAD(P)+)
VPRLAIIGATTWGATLGVTLAQKRHDVRLLARSEDEARRMRANQLYNLPLPGGKFPTRLSFTGSAEEALADARAVVLVVPAQSMRQNVRQIAPYVTPSMLVVSASKGLEIETGKRMTQIIAEELPAAFQRNICVLSGPNLAKEILGEHPAATVAAAESLEIARAAQRLLSTPRLCVYTNTDVVGVELGGALKNIIALAAGMADGLGYGDNAKAALMTRGWAEITALGVALGANPLTFSGLAGLGDLFATCASPLSRNHYVGMEIARGRKLADITDEMDNVAEGVGTTVAAWKLAQKLGLGMPITEKIYRVLYEGLEPRQAALDLLNAETHHELDGRKWRLLKAVRKNKPQASNSKF